jgi:hypothetical protein
MVLMAMGSLKVEVVEGRGKEAKGLLHSKASRSSKDNMSMTRDSH